ncbi:MAG: M3 family metallopeptidase [Glaciecola sp.]
MKKPLIGIICAAVVLSLSACSTTQQGSLDQQANTQIKDTLPNNVLVKPFEGPYGGVPAFNEMSLADLKPALEFAMQKSLAEYEVIANNPEPPTFENTIVAMEKASKELSRIFIYWGIWRSNKSSAEFRAIQRDMAPQISAYRSKISQKKALFERIKAVYESDEMATLTVEEKRIASNRYHGFVRNGALLNNTDKQRYAQINQELASLHTQFANNVLADEENYVLYLTGDQLNGLPESFKKAAAKMATDRGQDGMYAITNTRSSMDPFLTYSTDRDLRQRVWETYYSRGNNGDEYDNSDNIKQILTLRHERISLLGFDNYAQWRLEDRMAKTPENAMALMEKVWPAAIARVSEEVSDMQAIADSENANITIAPWDYRFYAEKVRKAKYDLDSDEVKQYLQLDKLREAMFYVAGRLFNFEFTPIPSGKVPVFHEDVNVWEVHDKTSGKFIGLWYLDPFARQGKRSGAWATTYRSYTTFEGEKSVLSSNNSNFVKGAPGEATLISWDDAETYFHEFGHALHFLAANVKYPSSHSGVRDYTEFQSQLLERWILTDEVINNYLVHYQTGEPIPASLVNKIKQASTFNEGFKTTEYLASAIMDLLYHTTDPANINTDTFEQEQLTRLGMPEEIVMRHRSTHFGHIFSGEGYAAAYYGYMWAEVLTSDAAEAFAQAPGGFYDEALSERLVKYLFAVRNAMEPSEAYRKFRGRDANVEALMRDRGFPVTGGEE